MALARNKYLDMQTKIQEGELQLEEQTVEDSPALPGSKDSEPSRRLLGEAGTKFTL